MTEQITLKDKIVLVCLNSAYGFLFEEFRQVFSACSY